METQQLSLRIYNAALTLVSKNIALLMVAQAKHETGNFTSSVFKTNNNCFGYKYYPGSKYQLPGKGKLSPEGNSYAAYKDVEHSAMEVASWVKRHIPNYVNIKTPVEYAVALKSAGYYGATIKEYAGGLTKFYSSTV